MPDRTDVAASERVAFTGSRGETLAARLDPPATAPRAHRAYALFAHCFTCGKDTATAARVSRGPAGRGAAAPRLDFTGLGESAGDFGITDLTSSVDDPASGPASPVVAPPVRVDDARLISDAARRPKSRRCGR